MEHAFCPLCGYDLKLSETVRVGGWEISPTRTLLNGCEITMTGCEQIILHTLAMAVGRFVSHTVLKERIDTGSDGNVIAVLVNRIRRRVPVGTIQTRVGVGYRFIAEPHQHPPHQHTNGQGPAGSVVLSHDNSNTRGGPHDPA